MVGKQMDKITAKSKMEGGKMSEIWLISHGLTQVLITN